MALITPLTVKSTRSMLQMQRMQPEMKRLQAKYKDDREKLNEELMKFYRENKINPLGGCLPIVAQMPVFIIMYRLLRGLTNRQGGLGSGIGHIAGQVQDGRHAHAVGVHRPVLPSRAPQHDHRALPVALHHQQDELPGDGPVALRLPGAGRSAW